MIIAQQPLIRVKTLLDLQESLDEDRLACRNFVARYVEIWPRRFERIHAAATAGNIEAALDSALSLRSASLMVGAARLGELTTGLIHILEDHSHSAAIKQLPALQSCGNLTMDQLTAFCNATD